MTDVWWIGAGHQRIISAESWYSAGITASDSIWNAANGYSIPTASFTSDQLNILENDGEFLLGQSGPRLGYPPVLPDGFQQSAYVYYKRIKDIYDGLIVRDNIANTFKHSSKVQIADNCYGAPATGGGFNISTTGTYEYFYDVGIDALDLRIGFGNWSDTIATGVHVDIDSSTSVTFSAGIRDAAGNVYALTFQGQRSVVLSGGLVLSDVLPIEVAKGDRIYVRVYISAGTAHWNRTVAGTGVAYSPGGFTAAGDYTATGSPAVTAAFAAGWAPMLIIGTPVNRDVPPKSVIVLGDSIAWGAFDGLSGASFVGYNAANPVYAGGGYFARALSGEAGFINAALQGDNMSYFLAGAGHFRRASLIEYARYAIIEYGFGDVNIGRTAAQLGADILTQANRNLAKGIIANIITTITPQTTSTDRFATTVNQTIFSSDIETQRIAHNTWVRDGGPIDPTTKLRVAAGTTGALRFGAVGHPIKTYLDVADVLESARDSGKFKVPNRIVTDGAATAATAVFNSATGNFTSADIGRSMTIPGAGTAGADLTTAIHDIISSTSVTVSDAIVTTVSAKTVGIGVWTADGIHPRCTGHMAIAAAIQAPLLAAMAA